MKKNIFLFYLLIAVFIFLNHYLLYRSDVLQKADMKLYDVLEEYALKNRKLPTAKVVVVDIDERSLKTLGQWPWPRVLLADLLAKIDRAGASTIALDVIFPEKDRTSPKEISLFYKRYFHLESFATSLPDALLDNDAIFADVIGKSGAVLSVFLSRNKNTAKACQDVSDAELPSMEDLPLHSYSYMLCNIPVIQNSARIYGFVNSYKDSDGLIRRMPLFVRYKRSVIPSLSVATLLSIDPVLKRIGRQEFKILGEDVKTNEKSEILLRFYPRNWYKKISAVDILQGKNLQKELEGKIVMIGSSAVGLHDNVLIAGSRQMMGTHIHVTMLENILHHDYLVQLDKYRYINILLSIAATFLLFYFLVAKRNFLIVTLFVLGIGLSLGTAYYAMQANIYLSIGYFIVPFLFHFGFVSFLYILIEAYQRYLFNKELGRTNLALLDSMIYVAEIHDTETGAHIIRTKHYVKELAEHLYYQGIYADELSKERIEIMFNTAPLHDIGKIGIPDAVLKKPGRLTKEEFEVIKRHPVIGAEIIDNAIVNYRDNEFFECARNIALYHHEKWDGSGYPEGLKGTQIPLEARLMALADVFDALISRRVYKDSFDEKRIRSIIVDGRGTHFDPAVVDAFLEIEYKFHEIAARFADNLVDKGDTL